LLFFSEQAADIEKIGWIQFGHGYLKGKCFRLFQTGTILNCETVPVTNSLSKQVIQI
jgi:hypothetical protein